jgi:hypothetical protein
MACAIDAICWTIQSGEKVMPALSITPPFPVFTDKNGTPLEDGYVYIGVANLEPVTNPINVYWNNILTTSAVQPIRTLAGYPSYYGTPSRIYTGEIAYSIKVFDKNGNIVFSSPFNTGPDVLVDFAVSEEVQVATAGQTVFNLANSYSPGTNSLTVYVDGVNQYDGSSYSYQETNGTTVTFNQGLHVGALVKFTTAIQLSGGATDASQVSYTPPFTGSVPTNVEDKLAEWVSPADFGAIGNAAPDGSSGTNDAAAFALLEAAYTNIVVNMQGKFYLVNSPIPTANNYINGKFVVAAASTDDQPVNFALGYRALSVNDYVPLQWPAGGGIDYASGNYNTAVGDSTLQANTTGRRNTALGSLALFTNTTGYYNTAVGPLALYNNTSGGENTAVGVQAGQSNTTGSDNVAVGSGAMSQHSTTNDCVAVGRQALQIASASTARVVAIGRQAAWKYTTGVDTVAIGYQALSAPGSVGSYNVAVGSAALGQTTTGDSNIAVGRRAANATTTGAGNVALGNDAMVGSGLPCTGSNNVAVGNTALPNITTGEYNIGIGASAASAITTGNYNVIVGRASGTAITSGSNNVAVGEQALTDITTGAQNTAVGSGAQAGGTTFNNVTVLGYGATGTNSNEVVLGNSSVGSLRCQVALTVVSDERDKVRFSDVPGLDFVNGVDAFVGKWNKRDGSENPEGTFAFLSAQNLQKMQSQFGVDLGLVNANNPDKLAATYERMIPVLVKAIQDLSREVAALKTTC